MSKVKKDISYLLLDVSEQLRFQEGLDKLKEEGKVNQVTGEVLESEILKLRKNIIEDRPENYDPFNYRHKYKNVKAITKITPATVVPMVASEKIAPYSNLLAKTAVFAPRKRGSAEDTGSKWIEIPSPRGIKILYNGPALTMQDQTLFLHISKLAEGHLPHDLVYIKRGTLLKSVGYKSLGSSSYDWLEKAFGRLKQATIRIEIQHAEITTGDNVYGKNEEIVNNNAVEQIPLKIAKLTVGLIDLYAQDTDGEYYFTMNPAILALFSNKMYGYNDLEKRRLLKNDLSAWLQTYICSDSKGEHKPVYVDTLRRFSGSKTRLNDFMKTLVKAFEELKLVGVIEDWRLLENKDQEKMVSWHR